VNALARHSIPALEDGGKGARQRDACVGAAKHPALDR
jgi:hypothetical protein